MPIVDLLTRFAATKNATPAQIALAWLLAQKPFIVSIPGTRNIDHLRENLGALDVQLTAADLSALDADFSKLTVHGGRMNEHADAGRGAGRLKEASIVMSKKVWLITGAGRGMGVDFARAALAAGHSVVASGPRPRASGQGLGSIERPAGCNARRHERR